jgi:hypothetical protein
MANDPDEHHHPRRCGCPAQQRCAQIFQKKVKGRAVEKGVAFPTCISVNEVVCNNSPLESEAEQQVPSHCLPPLHVRCQRWRCKKLKRQNQNVDTAYRACLEALHIAVAAAICDGARIT